MATRIKQPVGLTTTAQTAGETLIIGTVCLFMLTAIEPFLAAGIYETALFALFVICVVYYEARLALPKPGWRFQVLYELCYGAITGGLVFITLFLLIVWQMPTELIILDWPTFSERFAINTSTYFGDMTPTERADAIASFEFSLIDALGQFVAMLSASAFVTIRLGKRLWVWWKGLRSQYLIWEMTHAHLVLIVLSFALLLFFLTVYLINQTLIILQTDELTALIVVIAALVFTYLSGAIVGAVLLLGILVPAAVLSYWLSRPIVERLSALMYTTGDFSHGNYGARVTVSGEDEVGRLQENFNAMAHTLQYALLELRAERDMLNHLLSNRRELFTNISHELRTPIATIRSYLESMLNRQRQLPEALTHDLDIMYRETLHLQRLVDDLLVLTRAEEARLELNPQPTDIKPTLKRLAEAMAPAAWNSARVEILAELDHRLPSVYVDEVRLEQIVHNLMQNAVRHTPPGGIVVLSATVSGPDVVLQVRDTGTGINPNELPRIWERFYRSPSARQNYVRGAGLGLALVKELAEAMNGRVDVESTPGKGSTFMVWLPQTDIARQLEPPTP